MDNCATRKQTGAYNPPPLASLQESSHGEQPGESQTEREKKAKLLSRVGSWLARECLLPGDGG